MNWLLDCHVNNGLLALVQAIEESGCSYKFFSMEDEHLLRFDHFPEEQPVVFYGTFQVAALIAVQKPSWKPGAIYDPGTMRWDFYAPLLGRRLLNADHVVLPWGTVRDEWNSLLVQFGESRLFLRPESPNKSFSGQVVSDIYEFVRREGVYLAGMEASAGIVVAAPRSIVEEYRFLIVDERVVAGSGYRRAAQFEPFTEVPDDATHYAQEVADTLGTAFRPMRAYVLDIALAEGHRVVEVGPFSCCSLYAMDRREVVQAINDLDA